MGTRETSASHRALRRYAISGLVMGLGALLVLARGPREVATSAPPNASAEAGEATLPEPREIHFESGGNRLRGFLYLPNRPGRVPAIVYNHGSEQDPGLEWLGELGRFYQAHGFAVLFPWRQGCSGSEGKYWLERVPLDGDELDPAVRERRSIKALDQDLTDVLAAVDYVGTLPMVDTTKVTVAGSSFGGVLSVMAAARSTKIRSAVACSGAAWSYQGNTPDGQDVLDDLARSAKVPLFLFQAANDYNQGSSEQLGAVMEKAGVPHRVEVYPPHGKGQEQGHVHFCNHGMSAWGDDVLAFLNGPSASANER